MDSGSRSHRELVGGVRGEVGLELGVRRGGVREPERHRRGLVQGRLDHDQAVHLRAERTDALLLGCFQLYFQAFAAFWCVTQCSSMFLAFGVVSNYCISSVRNQKLCAKNPWSRNNKEPAPSAALHDCFRDLRLRDVDLHVEAPAPSARLVHDQVAERGEGPQRPQLDVQRDAVRPRPATPFLVVW